MCLFHSWKIIQTSPDPIRECKKCGKRQVLTEIWGDDIAGGGGKWTSNPEVFDCIEGYHKISLDEYLKEKGL